MLDDIKIGTCSQCGQEDIIYEWIDGNICSHCMMVQALSVVTFVKTKKGENDEKL